MIRKWLKLNTSFIEVLKNSAVPKNLEQKWGQDNTSKHLSSCSLDSISLQFNSVSPVSTTSFGRQTTLIHAFSDPKERGDAESQIFDCDSEGVETAVAETPGKTELFEMKGPNGSAFLIEVQAKDLEEVKNDLVRLKGDYFQFDKNIIGWFTMKCILTAEPQSQKDQERLAKIHAISSGSEEVYNGTGKFFFVNSVDRTMRAKRILEKFGYKISEIMYRFQPREKVSLDDRIREVCHQFVEAVERLPKVISITHNL